MTLICKLFHICMCLFLAHVQSDYREIATRKSTIYGVLELALQHIDKLWPALWKVQVPLLIAQDEGTSLGSRWQALYSSLIDLSSGCLALDLKMKRG